MKKNNVIAATAITLTMAACSAPKIATEPKNPTLETWNMSTTMFKAGYADVKFSGMNANLKDGQYAYFADAKKKTGNKVQNDRVLILADHAHNTTLMLKVPDADNSKALVAVSGTLTKSGKEKDITFPGIVMDMTGKNRKKTELAVPTNSGRDLLEDIKKIVDATGDAGAMIRDIVGFSGKEITKVFEFAGKKKKELGLVNNK